LFKLVALPPNLDAFPLSVGESIALKPATNCHEFSILNSWQFVQFGKFDNT